MKLVGLGPDAVFHRFLTPKWADRPLSGTGAALHGGRFNTPGTPALYLSRDPTTALAEYGQDASIAPPATLAAYLVTIGTVVDFSRGYEPASWDAPWAEWACAWKRIARIERAVPASWRIGDAVRRAGHGGLLFPSTRQAGGTNLVVFLQSLTPEDDLRVHDPDHSLPVDQSSWR